MSVLVPFSFDFCNIPSFFLIQVKNKVAWNKALSVDQAVVGLPVHQAVVGEVAGAVHEKDDLAFLKIMH